MYLKSIEVHGFKSFAHKLIFQFKGGITGIVGPNGSGKSNVADAVRWVLGEQSAKQLRGSKMEDVIFAGTESRKPLGFAYVAITFDNSDHKLPIDFDEVTVARRVYRSGESEYLINGSICLLKDVKEMFFDTGIGKEGYSIIGQGQIDKILSGKPEDRRELFDEAAGIVKYKRRKAATVKNLEAERQNLVRVNDILSELEIQVGPLKKQSDKARKYLDLREELKSKDIQMFIMEYERLNDEIENINSKNSIADNDLSDALAKYEESKNRIDEMDEKGHSLSQSIEAMVTNVNNNRVKAEQLEGNIKLYEERIETAKSSGDENEKKINELKAKLLASEEELSLLKAQKNDNDAQIMELQNNETKAKEDMENVFSSIRTKEAEIDECNQSLVNAMNEASRIKSEKARYEAMLENCQVEKAQMNQSLIRLKADMDEAEEKAGKYEEEVTALKSAIDEKTAEVNNIRKNISSDDAKKIEAGKKLENYQRQFHTYNSQINTLKSISERYEGYGQSIKKVMELKAENKGIIGVVADIIKVEKRFETAVETSLGGNIQNIVTDTDETAKEMINFIKENKFGRATFLPMSSIVADAPYDKKLDDEKGVLGPVSDFVDTKPEYKEIIKYLIGRFVLVDNVDNALKLAKKYNRTLRIVTLEGEFLNVGGSISGGAFKNKGNLLARKREIDELTSKLDDTKEHIDAINKEIHAINDARQAMNLELSRVNEELNRLRLDLNTKEMQFSQVKQAGLEKKADYDNAKNDNKQIETRKLALSQALKDADELLSKLDVSKADSDKNLETLNDELEKLKGMRAKMHETINQINLDKISFESKMSFIAENISRVTETISGTNAEIENITNTKTASLMQIKSTTEAIDAVKEAITNLKKETDELNTKIAESKTEFESIEELKKKAATEREKLADIRNELEKEQIRIQNQTEKLKASFATLNQYMWNEYELTYRGALEFKSETDFDYDTLKRETNELKQRIRNLGDVNVNSIEEYIQVSERYDTMKTQHDDIVKSEERLVSFIDELEEKMRVQFLEKFEEIKEQYNIVFRELFGGGKGTLKLMEDEDVLECGIQIIAQPPGKTLKNMSMLSGGEKALSAIAILFAIQNLKPSPFCLLDEIEAALDDSNVKRFAKYLNKLKYKTQYIVITHRQGTMAAADTLYGITMQEKGVSTLVSVDLVEQQLKKEVKNNG